MSTYQISMPDHPVVHSTVTSQQGSWKWQRAYRVASYIPHQCKDGHWCWWSIGHSNKFARTRATEALFEGGVGSLHCDRIVPQVDDFGNLFFVGPKF